MSSIDQDFKIDLRERLNRIENKVDSLYAFKWQIIGWSGATGTILSIVVALIAEWIKK